MDFFSDFINRLVTDQVEMPDDIREAIYSNLRDLYEDLEKDKEPNSYDSDLQRLELVASGLEEDALKLKEANKKLEDSIGQLTESLDTLRDNVNKICDYKSS